MKRSVWWLLGILGASCLGGGYYAYAQKKPAKSSAQDPWEEEDARMSAAMKKAIGDAWDGSFADNILRRQFPPLFDEKDPRGPLDLLPQGESRYFFGLPRDKEFADQTQFAAPIIRSTKDRVIVSLTLPAAKDGVLKAKVDANEIRVSYTADVVNEKDNGRGVYEKKESQETLQEILPIPPGARADTAKVSRQGDSLNITFNRS